MFESLIAPLWPIVYLSGTAASYGVRVECGAAVILGGGFLALACEDYSK